MNLSWRTIALVLAVALAGALGTLAVAVAMGMGGDALHLLSFLAPAAAVTVVVALLTGPLLSRASLRQRFVAVALVAAVAALANLAVLTRQMFLSDDDGTLVIVLLVYSLGAGLAAALVSARGTSQAVARLDRTAEALGRGELDVRVGALGAGPELDRLAGTLDAMASQLQAASAREREIEATRRDLITAVSHDLRTPLSSIRAMVEAIDEGVVEDVPTVRRYAGEMRRSVDQLVSMVDDLFELVQLDAGAIEAETRRVRLDDVVRSALAAVDRMAMEKGLSLTAQLNGAEAALCSPRLVRVLANLLSNAVRHTPADGAIMIEAEARHDGRLALAVNDDGEGISPEDLPRVFEPFFRGDPSRSGGGAGLGLALAKRIVEAMGGDITAQSVPTAGARFELSVPLLV